MAEELEADILVLSSIFFFEQSLKMKKTCEITADQFFKLQLVQVSQISKEALGGLDKFTI